MQRAFFCCLCSLSFFFSQSGEWSSLLAAWAAFCFFFWGDGAAAEQSVCIPERKSSGRRELSTCTHTLRARTLYVQAPSMRTNFLYARIFYLTHFLCARTLYVHAPSIRTQFLCARIFYAHAPSMRTHPLCVRILYTHAFSMHTHPLCARTLYAHAPSMRTHPLCARIFYTHAFSMRTHFPCAHTLIVNSSSYTYSSIYYIVLYTIYV